MNTRVNLTKRVKVGGADRYCPVVVAGNGRIKPGWVVVDGREERIAAGGYYLDWTEDGKRLAVGSDAAEQTRDGCGSRPSYTR